MSVACLQKVAMFSPVAIFHNLMDILSVRCREAPENRPHGENVNASARCHPWGRHITNRMSEAGFIGARRRASAQARSRVDK